MPMRSEPKQRRRLPQLPYTLPVQSYAHLTRNNAPLCHASPWLPDALQSKALTDPPIAPTKRPLSLRSCPFTQLPNAILCHSLPTPCFANTALRHATLCQYRTALGHASAFLGNPLPTRCTLCVAVPVLPAAWPPPAPHDASCPCAYETVSLLSLPACVGPFPALRPKLGR